MTLTIDGRDGKYKVRYPDPEETTCKQCGRTITPSINGPCPRQGRYNGFADCIHCGAILRVISPDEFERI